MKTYYNKIKSFLLENEMFLWITVSFSLWIYCFRGFIFNKLTLVADALPYFGHFKFYLENLSKGVFPLWDPTRNVGVPNEFFLRRIGEFNPFYLIILILDKIGFSYREAYLIFLVAYFFLGMIGFYFLAKKILKDKQAAFIAFALFLFSSIGTRLFASYVILLFLPMAWFFYFLIDFSSSPKKSSMLGMVFSLMIILITYLPFYFITIFASFIVCFSVIYIKETFLTVKKGFIFVFKNKIFTLFCISLLFLSALPGYNFYKESNRGAFTLPVRHADAAEQNVISVGYNRTEPSIFAHIKLDKILSNLTEIKLHVLYVPIFAYILLFLSVYSNISRISLFLMLWIFMLFLISSPESSVVYKYLYDHVFYFKYFRNFRFVLWIVMLPCFLLFCAANFSLFIKNILNKKKDYLVFAMIVQILFLSFLFTQKNIILSSKLAVLLSIILMLIIFLKRTNNKVMYLVLLLAISVQPIEVFNYLQKNSDFIADTKYEYERDYLNFNTYRTNINKVKQVRWQENELFVRPRSLYIAVTSFYYDIYTKMDFVVLSNYLSNRLIAYDNWELFKNKAEIAKPLEEKWRKNKNLVFLNNVPDLDENKIFNQEKVSTDFLVLAEGSSAIQMLEFNPNLLKVKTNFESKKILVYYDANYVGWSVYLNGKKQKMLIADGCFKAISVPAGSNIVMFKFGSDLQYLFKWLYSLMYLSVLISLIFLMKKEKNLSTN